MLFRELKAGDAVYVLDKANVNAERATVSNVTPPHVSTQPGMMGMYVDITLACKEGAKTYVVSEGGVTAYADGNNVVVTTDVNNVLAELRTIKAHCEEVLQNADKYKEDIEKCDTLLADLDPVYKERQVTERRISKLEEAIASQAETSKEMTKLLKELLGK